MKIKILKESNLLQENIEIKTEEVLNNQSGLKVYFTIDTGNIVVKQQLTIRGKKPGSAEDIFGVQLPKVQKCFPKPPEVTYKGDTLDPIHQLQIDYEYVYQDPQYEINTLGQKIYSHDNNVWILGDPVSYGPIIWSIDFQVIDVDGKGLNSPGQEYDSNPFNSLGSSMAFFRKLTQTIGEYVAKYPYRLYYFFGITEQGESEDLPSKRTRLYTTMLKKMYKELGGDWVQFEEIYEGETDPNSNFFFKCPGSAISESKKRKFYLTIEDKKLIQEVYNKEIQNFLMEKCQKGYKTHKTRKTKVMFGKRYRNCVKAEENKIKSNKKKLKIRKQKNEST